MGGALLEFPSNFKSSRESNPPEPETLLVAAAAESTPPPSGGVIGDRLSAGTKRHANRTSSKSDVSFVEVPGPLNTKKRDDTQEKPNDKNGQGDADVDDARFAWRLVPPKECIPAWTWKRWVFMLI